MQATVATITLVQEEAGETTEVSLLNFVVSDGPTLVATRYASREDCPAATMYYAEGMRVWQCPQHPGESAPLPCTNNVSWQTSVALTVCNSLSV